MGFHDLRPCRPAAFSRLFRRLLPGALLFGVPLLGALAEPAVLLAKEAAKEAAPAAGGADDLLIVDCLLPQKVRRLGRNNSYLAPRQPIRTTGADCRVRGGEYTEPDQANYQTSLKVWLPQAEAGDAEAMYYAGQIYEKGLGIAPDYKNAAAWYRQAADKGYGPAAVALGALYEQGQGVAKDDLEALNWYRKAAGLAQDLVVLEAGEYEALQKAKAELEQKTGELDKLKKEIEELHRQIGGLEKSSAEGQERQATLQSLAARLEGELAAKQRELAAGRGRLAELERSQAASQASAAVLPAAIAAGGGVAKATFKEIPFGQFHALVIGNGAYAQLPALAGAEGEAREVAQLLEKKYGFKVRLLVNATRVDILEALNDYREKLTQKDNFLVYYAGHGQRDAAGATAYWQPVDADPARPTRWINSGVLTEHLDLIAANHVFVVANSVFAGLRTRSSVARLPQGMTDEQRYYHIKLLMDKRARLVLSSGAGAGGGDAAAEAGFAGAFLDALRQNDGVLEASALYQKVNDQLYQEHQDSSSMEFAAMKWARNDLAEFFFVPAALR